MAARSKLTERSLKASAESVCAAMVCDADAAAAGRADELAALVDGTLEAADRELLEKELQEQPFLAASLRELEELRAELNGSAKPRRSLAFAFPGVLWRSYRPLAAAAAIAAVVMGSYYALARAPRPARSVGSQVATARPDKTPSRVEAIFSSDFEDPSLAGWAIETGSPRPGDR